MSCSVAILTLDEEQNLPRLLATLGWCDDIVVIDSGSRDATVEIARSAGARVVERRLDTWDAQGNFMLHEVEYRHPWLYYSDADEELPPDLIAEIADVTSADAAARAPEVAAYRLRYRNLWRGRWLRHATLYPTWITRLMRPERCRYERREVNAHPIADGEVRDLAAHFHHHPMARGVEHWLAKHDAYALGEARENLRTADEPVAWGDLFATDPMRRRRALKLASARMPMRPSLKFAYLYLWRRGFLDGAPGFDYVRLQCRYEAMIVRHLRELRRAARP
jgi:glycosyltransferase involved in cell wall biosynthesis